MTCQGIHFDAVLMTLSQCEAKEEEEEEEEERKVDAKEECQCEAEEREGEAEARLLEGSQYVQKAEGSKHDVLRVDLSWV